MKVRASSLPGHGFVEDHVHPTNGVVIIETETGRTIFAVSGPDLSPEDRWIVTADTNNVIHLHDASDGRRIACQRHP
ncbi:MAG TPA: hypothetical protein PLX89_14125 [Verrucomicrobiota bacterium]|nr:hypothetical protein [Verrucomicrobiales bacterium]HRI14129.1 hypothetical protein [Verrucomicrobiota bacterium]